MKIWEKYNRKEGKREENRGKKRKIFKVRRMREEKWVKEKKESEMKIWENA